MELVKSDRKVSRDFIRTLTVKKARTEAAAAAAAAVTEWYDIRTYKRTRVLASYVSD